MAHLRPGIAHRFTSLLLALLVTACGSTPTLTPVPTITESVVPPIPTLSITPTPTLIQPAGNGWQTYTNASRGVSFSYPSGWQEQAPAFLIGPDGFVRIETYPGDRAAVEAVCQQEANRGKPDRYGAFPQITAVEGLEPAAENCLILPSDDQPVERQGEALFLWWNPVHNYDVIALYSDQEHIIDIARSLQPTRSAPATNATIACQPLPADNPPVEYNENGLHITEVPVAQAVDCSLSRNPQAIYALISEGLAAERTQQVVSGQWSAARLKRLNDRLAPFGFRIRASEQMFSISKNGTVLRGKLNWIGHLSVNASLTDFILPVVDSYNSQVYLVHPDGLHPIEEWNILTYDRVFPVYVGDDLISLAYDYQRYPRPVNNPALVEVRQDDTTLPTFSVTGSTSAGGSVRVLWSWDGHWVAELLGVIIQDGEILNEKLGYSEMFAWRLLNDQPFYFFRQKGQLHASYNGQVLPLTYDEVIYQPQGGMGVLLQMKSYESGLLFFARRGNTWYYVVLDAGAN